MRRFVWNMVVMSLAAMLLMTGCGAKTKEKLELRNAGIDKLNAGDYHGAIESFDQALERSKKVVGEFELDVLKYRADAETGAEDYEAAAHTYEVLCQVEEEKPEYLYRLCMLYERMEALDKATGQRDGCRRVISFGTRAFPKRTIRRGHGALYGGYECRNSKR